MFNFGLVHLADFIAPLRPHGHHTPDIVCLLTQKQKEKKSDI
jgi:hypothetical protein